jgi:hypothetical protein
MHRNFARGLGLVYNPGERIEGYTNFLWTLLIGFGFKLHLDPEAVAKIAGGVASLGALAAVFVMSERLRPFSSFPCIATWLMATSIVQSGYAVFGLETSLFTCLVLWGLILLFREHERGTGFPISGLVFGLAGLTRPEAAMYLGIPMLLLGRSFVERQNLVRGVCFTVIVGAHMLWRHAYYGTCLPNSFAAKTGDLTQQLRLGEAYLRSYAHHSWPALLLAVAGLYLVTRRLPSARPEGRAASARQSEFEAHSIIVVGAASLGYVLLVGGDWMPYFRFLGPFEPFCFVLACVGTRTLVDSLGGEIRRPLLAMLIVGVVSFVGVFRVRELNAAQQLILSSEKVFWDSAAGETATWLVIERPPGEIAVGDIGYIGYATDYPILDLLGLVDPVISNLPGGYTQKTGQGYVERVFEKSPRYFVFVGSANGCSRLPFPAQERLRQDDRFQRAYRLGTVIPHSKGGVWCIFERNDPDRPLTSHLRPGGGAAPSFIRSCLTSSVFSAQGSVSMQRQARPARPLAPAGTTMPMLEYPRREDWRARLAP